MIPPHVRAAPYTLWRLTSGERTAVCELRRLPAGNDLRLFLDGELQRTALCRAADEWLRLAFDWRVALEAEGYREVPAS